MDKTEVDSIRRKYERGDTMAELAKYHKRSQRIISRAIHGHHPIVYDSCGLRNTTYVPADKVRWAHFNYLTSVAELATRYDVSETIIERLLGERSALSPLKRRRIAMMASNDWPLDTIARTLGLSQRHVQDVLSRSQNRNA